MTLISISHLTSASCRAVFDSKTCQIFNAKQQLLGEVSIANSLYKTQHMYLIPTTAMAKGDEWLTMAELHACLSHIGVTTIREMITKGMISGVTLHQDHSDMGQCIACEYGKTVRKPIGNIHEPNHSAILGDEVHTDVWGPSSVQMPGKRSYYCSFTDDHTCYTCINLMFAKSDTFSAYLEYKSWLKTQHGAAVKHLHSDHRGEYLSGKFSCHLKCNETERKLTTHDTPEHNGVTK